ncbi:MULTISPECIES: hypothetical protein [Citromicrobium]|uniref:hypothetical protein n=1 Tax=Citromicrobium TaxID=72173 RepID=UPI0001DD10C4|nr:MULTISPECIES: hypothetical protein [Citromicrobium]
MFKIVDSVTFTRKVTAHVPDGDGQVPETFKATFRSIPPEEADEFNLMSTEGASEFLRRVVVRLDDIGDAQGKPVDYSDEVRDQVIRLPWARGALARTYFEEVRGAKLGN